jgi:Tol biopolymer transport system component
MKRIDADERGILDIAWSPDNRWIAYSRGAGEVCLANVESGEIRVVGPGVCPGITPDNSVVLERDDEILLVTGAGTRTVVSRGDLVRGAPKRGPQLSPDGSRILFVVCNVFDKESQSRNAYPYRHFLGLADTATGRARLTGEQWYGGFASWFPDGEMLTHHEFDSTGGARVHVLAAGSGELRGMMFGLFPSVSPDGRRIACKPRGGGNIVVYTSRDGGWGEDAVDVAVFKLPESDGRISATAPLWLDTRLVLVDEGGKLLRVDTRKEKSEELKRIPAPVRRGRHTMALSPNRELLALEHAVEGGFELVAAPLT